ARLPAGPRPRPGRRRSRARALTSRSTVARFEQFPLPDPGEGLTEADVVAWPGAVGDAVAANPTFAQAATAHAPARLPRAPAGVALAGTQTIVEVEPATSLVARPSPFAGVVAELLVPEGRPVEVGTPLISIDPAPPAGPADPPAEQPAADDAPAEGASVSPQGE